MESFASDLSHQVLEARRRRGELSLPQQDFSRERPYLVPQRPVIRFWDASEGQVWLTEDGSDQGGCARGGRDRSLRSR